MKKMPSLTGIRAVAALWVMFFHMSENFHWNFTSPFLAKGYLGVDLFFILSGFIISYVHQHEFMRFSVETTKRFLLLRCARIFPVHWLMLVTLLGIWFLSKDVFLIPLGHPERYNAQDFILHLLNIQDWGFSPHYSWNIPAWSVSAEWFVYLLFPFITPIISRMKRFWANLALIGFSFAFLWGYSQVNHLPNLDLSFEHGLVRCVAEFIMGCALFNLHQLEPAESNAGLHTVRSGLVYPALGGLAISLAFSWPDRVVVLFLVLLIFALGTGRTWVHQWLSGGFAVFLGEISYSIYMAHGNCITIVHQLNRKFPVLTAQASWQNLGVNIGFMLAVILIAYGLYKTVELPSRNLARASLSGQKK